MAARDEVAGPDRRRLAALAAVAVAVLAAGALLRPDDATIEPPVSLTESATLRALSRRATFQDMTDFASERIGLTEPYLVYLTSLQRSGVRWGSADSAVTAGDSLPVVLAPAEDSGAPPPTGAAALLSTPRWVLIAARKANGGIASSIGVSGGPVRVPCGEREQPALLLSVPLNQPLAGGGVFDLDGTLVGIVARCGEGYAALPVTELEAALHSAEPEASRVHGVELAELDSLSRRHFRADSGAVVVAVALAGPGGRAGLRPGDVILDPAEFAAMPDSLPGLAVLRAGQIVRPRPAAPSSADAGLTLATEPEGIEIASVAPDSPAARAGLHPGDRIVRLGQVERPSRQSVLRALSTRADAPLYLAFQRDGDERGTFLRP
jgi:hypothetical protein